MATGDLRRPTRRQRRRIDEAVQLAESTTGLQLCVVLGPGGGEAARERAEAAFVTSGLLERPAVLVLVDPKEHHVEIVTGPQARARISDADAADAIQRMAAPFRAGDLVGGLTAGLEHLVACAGPGVAPEGQDEIANLIEPDDA